MSSQALLDLEWVLTSPSLVDDPMAVGPIDFDPAAVDADHLEAFLADRSEHRVGRYFEHLVHYWLAHVRNVELVDVGRQVIDDQRRTIGEIDFLFRDERGVLTHCEVAVKFFLHYPNEDGSDFPGPAARDNFERKATRLFDTQLFLSEAYVPEVQSRVGMVRGRVFERAGRAGPAELPPRMAAGRLGGLWAREFELETLCSDEVSGFHIVEKPHWFAPVVDPQILTREEFTATLAEHFDGPAYPAMVSLRDAHGTERHRCFVVPPSWPVVSD